VWWKKVATEAPVRASQRETVLSEEAGARVFVYWSHCTALTESVWPSTPAHQATV
jgi:hypothetical protein